LGYDVLTLVDERVQFADGNPVAQGDHDYIVDAASRMYEELSPETHEFFTVMQERELMDLKSRDGKATGGYCTSFPVYQVPFIFANFNQTSHDVEVLTHEAGHAFQAWRSRNYAVPEYQWPTAEACEIHSMSMEYLTWPWMNAFFGDQTEKFKFFHLAGSIQFLPYGCMVDAFQHWVYGNPDATPSQRLGTWKELEKTYMPWRVNADVPEAEEGRHWQFQRHIYESPFYYIDYTLASTCAMQYLVWAQKDPKGAFESYLRVCDVGGSKAFLDIVKEGGLRSPFAPNSLREVVGDCFSWLKTTYPFYF
jgi:M3 family oligoendopeptidase